MSAAATQGSVEWRKSLHDEVPLLVKTSAVAYSRVEELIRANHPYELPEIVGIPVGHGLPAYLEWVAGQVGATPAQ